MKRSLHVTAPLLTATALAILTGCDTVQPKRCVDEQNRVVDDSFCNADPQDRARNPYVPWNTFHFYYGGTGGFFPGSSATGGSLSPAPGVSYSTATSRGGFGGHAGGRGGSGQGGGGGGE